MGLNRRKKILTFVLFAFIFFISTAGFAFAMEINYPRIPGAEAPQDFLKTATSGQVFTLFAKYIFVFAVWISGILILGVLIYAAFQYLTSAGRIQQTIEAKNRILGAFLGALILFSAVIVFSILNPQLTILNIPSLEQIIPIIYPAVPTPPLKNFQSRIYTEIPFGTLIDKIFETTANQRPKEKQEKKAPRLKTIELLTASTVKLATNLENQSSDIQKAAHKCKCENAEPVCGSGCSSGKSCDCDTCKNSRSEIEKNQQKNTNNIAELKRVQQSIKEEIRILDMDIGKLEKAEKFMADCQLARLESLSANLATKKELEAQKFTLTINKYWKNIFIDEDFGTFYCPISGTLVGTYGEDRYASSVASVSDEDEEDMPEEFKEESKPPACSMEVPVGEIIDRAEKLGHRLSERMSAIIMASQQLIDAVEKLQVSVSECTSQNPRCRSVCRQTISGCKKIRCEGETCKFDEIDKNFDEVKKIKNEVVEHIANSADKNDVGILPIVQKAAPRVVQDLDINVRRGSNTMKECATEPTTGQGEIPSAPIRRLTDCLLAYGAFGPGNIPIESCCARKQEYQRNVLGQPTDIVQNSYRECGQECYAWEEYRQCLDRCLNRKAEEALKKGISPYEAENIRQCRALDNFFCCNP